MKLNTLGFEKDDMSFGLYELYNKEVEVGIETGIWSCRETSYGEKRPMN